ncbi:MAG TPA: DUF1707 domain-containing protein [Conexibacter sp.]|jgi:hypothetical protein
MSERPDPRLRASDEERERAATQLREHCAVGRITPEELDERLDHAYAARTVSELQSLLSDLPALPAAPPRAGHDPAREEAKREVLHGAGVWLLVSVAAIAVWAASGANGSFWPIWLILLGGIRFAFFGWNRLSPGAEERLRMRNGRGHSSRPREVERGPQRPRRAPADDGQEARRAPEQR